MKDQQFLNVMERRKRVCEKKSSYNNEIKKKRVNEPRPHPPDCLNKRFWDDVRAGRIPEPKWTGRKNEKVLRLNSKKSVCNRKISQLHPNSLATSSILPCYNRNNFPANFHFPQLSLSSFTNPTISLPSSSIDFKNISTFSLSSSTPLISKFVYF